MNIKIILSCIFCLLFLSCKYNQNTNKVIGLSRETEKQKTENNIKNYILEIIKDDYKFLNDSQKKFKYDSFDLNSDGKEEYIIFLQNNYFCGTGGCTYFLLSNNGSLITKFTVSTNPFKVLKNKTNDWFDIVIQINGNNKVLKFNGESYPSNPSLVNNYSKEISEYDVIKVLLADSAQEYTL